MVVNWVEEGERPKTIMMTYAEYIACERRSRDYALLTLFMSLSKHTTHD